MRDMKENIMTPDNFIVRTMNRSEIDLAITWAATEGWNPGSYDAESFYQTDENGFFVGELNGEPVGCISAVAYDQHFGFLGFYIVKPQFRGQHKSNLMTFKRSIFNNDEVDNLVRKGK